MEADGAPKDAEKARSEAETKDGVKGNVKAEDVKMQDGVEGGSAKEEVHFLVPCPCSSQAFPTEAG